MHVTYLSFDVQVRIGRLPGNALVVADAEVSGLHAVLRWDPAVGAWLAADAGSLNGTALNGQRISIGGRRPGQSHRLNSDDILQLGSTTCIKVQRPALAHSVQRFAVMPLIPCGGNAQGCLPVSHVMHWCQR